MSNFRIVTLTVALAAVLGLTGALWADSVQAAHPAHNTMVYDSMGAAQLHAPAPPARIVRDNGPDCDTFSYKLVHGRYTRAHHPCRFGNGTMDYSPNYRKLLSFGLGFGGAATEEAVAAEAVVAAKVAPAEEPVAEEAAPVEETVAEAAVEAAASTEELTPTADIVTTVIAAGDFTTLVAALEAAGLADTLHGDGPFTLFAPTDAAFAALPEGALDGLMADPEGALKDVLLYHVVSRPIVAANILDRLEEATLEGDLVVFTIDGDTVKVNEAVIVISDIEATNGVIHAIDAVLAPPAQ